MPPRVRKRKICSCCEIPSSTLSSSQPEKVTKRQRVQNIKEVPAEPEPVVEHVVEEPVSQPPVTSQVSVDQSNSLTLSNLLACDMEEMNEDIVFESTGHSTRRITHRTHRIVRGLDFVHTFIKEVTFTIASTAVGYVGQELRPYQARPDVLKSFTPASSTVPEKSSVTSTATEQQHTHSLDDAFSIHSYTSDSDSEDGVKNIKRSFIENDSSLENSDSDSGKSGSGFADRSGTDTGKSGTDTGKSGTDTGKNGTDTGKSGTDTGKSGTDTGKSASYSGKNGTDTGKSETDTGKIGSNSGKSGTGFSNTRNACVSESGEECQRHHGNIRIRCKNCYSASYCEKRIVPKPCAREMEKLHEAFLTDSTDREEYAILQEVKIGNQDCSPCIYLYTNELLTICNRQQHNLRVTRTLNLGACFVTAFVFRNSNLIYNKPYNKDQTYGPLMIGPVMIHFDKAPETYARFFETICQNADIVKKPMSEGEMKNMAGVQRRDYVITRPMRKVFGSNMSLAGIHHVPIHLRTDLKHSVSCNSSASSAMRVIYNKFDQERQQTRQTIAGADGNTWSLHPRAKYFLETLELSDLAGKLLALDRLSLECW